MDLFQFLNAVTNDKEDLNFNDDSINKSYNPYMMNRFISMCDLYIPFVAEINKYNVPKDVHYKYYLSLLPKRKQFFKYIKKKNDIDYSEKRILAHHFQCNINKIDVMVSMMSEKEVKIILNKYKDGNGNLIDI